MPMTAEMICKKKIRLMEPFSSADAAHLFSRAVER